MKTFTLSPSDEGAMCFEMRSLLTYPVTPNESGRYEPDCIENKNGHFEVHTLPVSVGLVNGVNNLEGLRVFLLEVVKLFLEQDIFGSDVGENEGELGLVSLVLQCLFEDLVHGSDAASTSNHTNLFKLVC